jgi:hypothetical protein
VIRVESLHHPREVPITMEVIEFAKRFKPTLGDGTAA